MTSSGFYWIASIIGLARFTVGFYSLFRGGDDMLYIYVTATGLSQLGILLIAETVENYRALSFMGTVFGIAGIFGSLLVENPLVFMLSVLESIISFGYYHSFTNTIHGQRSVQIPEAEYVVLSSEELEEGVSEYPVGLPLDSEDEE